MHLPNKRVWGECAHTGLRVTKLVSRKGLMVVEFNTDLTYTLIPIYHTSKGRNFNGHSHNLWMNFTV